MVQCKDCDDDREFKDKKALLQHAYHKHDGKSPHSGSHWNWKKYSGFAVVGVLIVMVVGFILPGAFKSSGSSPDVDVPAGEYKELAICLSEKDVTMWGAFWCPHCKSNKAMFGDAWDQYMNYVECSTPDGKSQLKICEDKGITNYPTWIFADGSRLTGQIIPEELAARVGC